MKRLAWIALLLTILLPLPYSLGQEVPPPPEPASEQDAPSGESLRAVSGVPDSVWDAPLPMFTGPQEVAVYYLAAVLADKQEHAATLTESRKKKFASQEFMAEFREDVEVASLRIETVAAVNNQAWVVSEPVKLKKEDPDLGDDPRVILALRGSSESECQHWLITNVEIVPAAHAKKALATLNDQVDLSKAPYRIRVGDKLCFGSPDDTSHTYTVQPDGTITWGPLGRVWASGLTARELRDRVEEGFNSYFETATTWPPITVMPAKGNTDGATGAEVSPAPPAPATSSPRTAAAAFIAAAREGRVAEALTLVKGPGNTDRHTIEILGKVLAGKPPVLESVLVSQRAGKAAALFLAHFTAKELSAESPAADLLPDWTDRILLLLTRTDEGWFVTGDEIDSRDNEFVANELHTFQTTHPDATFDWMVEQKQKRESIVGTTHPAPPLYASTPGYANAYVQPPMPVPSYRLSHAASTPGMAPGTSGPRMRMIEGGNLIVSWSERGDAVWGYSMNLGRWTRQEIEPAAKKGLTPLAGTNVAFLQVGRLFYGYSAQTGQWHQFQLAPDQDPEKAQVTISDDTAVLTVGDNIYTFAGSTGRWSSRDGSILDPTEATPGTAAIPTPQLATLRADYDRLEQEAACVVKKHRDAPEASRLPDITPALERDVTKIVQQAFVARQQLQRAELAAFRRRLDAIEKQIDDRDRMQTEIIQHRVKELLDPNLKWDSAVAPGEASDAPDAARANEPVPAEPPVDSPPFEINAYFSPNSALSTRTDVATAGESVYLLLDVTSPKKQSLTDLTISIQLDESLKAQTAASGFLCVENQVTWQNQSVEADQAGRYAVQCLCLAPTPSANCQVTVTDASGQRQTRDVPLRIDPGETSRSSPTDDHTSQSLNDT